MPASVPKVRWRCQQCGKSRWLKPHRARLQRYCSRACLHASKRVEHPVREKPSAKRTFGNRECQQCGAGYEARSKLQRFCSQDCSTANVHQRRIRLDVVARPCEHCGEPFRPRPESSGRFCSRPCTYAGSRGPKSPHWRGGRYVGAEGYVRVYAPDHPSAFGHGGYVKEHRLVMEKMLGRRLESQETVHHKNCIKSDNRPENLELWSGQHGRGARAHEHAPHCPTCTCGK